MTWQPPGPRSLLAAALTALLLVAGCGAGSSSRSDAATPSGGAGSSQPASGSPEGPAPVDALSLTGPVVAAELPDMEPVVSGVSPHLPTTVTDSSGTTVKVASAQRVVALDLYGTLVDTLIGLGLHDRLVGRAESDTQAVLADLPVVSTGGIELNVEAVLGLDPDLVLTNLTIGSDRVYEQLEKAGVTVVRFAETPSIEGIPDAIDAVGAVFGVGEAAHELAEHTQQRIAEAREEITALRAATPRAPRAVMVYVRGAGGLFFIFGAGYGAADLITELGLDDVATANGITKLVPASPEALSSLDPEIILTMTQGVESGGGVGALLARPGMSATTAGVNRRIISADDTQLLSYGPRTPDNLLALARAVYVPAR